jgi:cyclopropane fatty-acyl-phospholipid synthase-like methyltransferase
MKDLKTSIVESLDGGANPEIFPFLPYILQDIEEIGTDPVLVEKLIRKHIGSKPLKVLDLGCGKGAVSVHHAAKLGCMVTGIDGMQEFVDAAIALAEKHKVSHLCSFRQGDIREEINTCSGFDVIILGAIGPVFGLIRDTLRTVTPALKPGGYVIIDDGFKEDGALPEYDRVVSRLEFYGQIAETCFTVVEELILPSAELTKSNLEIQDKIVMRAEELTSRYPEKEKIFRAYIQEQENEIDLMDGKLVVGIWLLQSGHDSRQ